MTRPGGQCAEKDTEGITKDWGHLLASPQALLVAAALSPEGAGLSVTVTAPLTLPPEAPMTPPTNCWQGASTSRCGHSRPEGPESRALASRRCQDVAAAPGCYGTGPEGSMCF